jgi:hypothetical protein
LAVLLPCEGIRESAGSPVGEGVMSRDPLDRTAQDRGSLHRGEASTPTLSSISSASLRVFPAFSAFGPGASSLKGKARSPYTPIREPGASPYRGAR